MNLDELRALPKVVLHDHLDGGLRPASVIELAAEHGYRGLPTTDVDDLSRWFHRGAKRNDLVLYLETFAHTVGVMQQRDAIERVAYECARDLALKVIRRRLDGPAVSIWERAARPAEGYPPAEDHSPADGPETVIPILVQSGA